MKREYLSPESPLLEDCAFYERVLRNRLSSYEEFVDRFHTMTEEELQKFDIFYYYSNYKQIDSHIYNLLRNNEFWTSEKCSAIHKNLTEEGRDEDFIYQILRYFLLSPKQIAIEQSEDNKLNKLWLAIPDVENNIAVVEKSVTLWGYSVIHKEKDSTKSQKYDTGWYLLTIVKD